MIIAPAEFCAVTDVGFVIATDELASDEVVVVTFVAASFVVKFGVEVAGLVATSVIFAVEVLNPEMLISEWVDPTVESFFIVEEVLVDEVVLLGFSVVFAVSVEFAVAVPVLPFTVTGNMFALVCVAFEVAGVVDDELKVCVVAVFFGFPLDVVGEVLA